MERIKVLKSLIVNFPIFWSWGYRITKILTILVDEGQEQKAIEALSTFEKPLVIDEYLKENDIAEMFANNRSQAVFYLLSQKNKRTERILDFLQLAVSTSYVKGNPVSVIPIVITSKAMLLDEREMHFMISIDGDWSNFNLHYREIVPDAKDINSAEILYREVVPPSDDIANIMNLANIMIYLKDRNVDMREQRFMMIRNLISSNENLQAYEGLEELFLYLLEQWIGENAEMVMVCELPCVDNNAYNHLAETLFYTDDYVFMHEILFQKITKSSESQYPINALKMALKNAEILITESKSSVYTTKMNFYREMGMFDRKRMLKFQRSKLSRPGEMDIIDAISL
ncbi:MAG: hypothetical protein SPF70_12795 [Lachnospiraceae bacterium]|nr:hypothetical protein [Lachnospiraceae bacterium]